MFFFRRRSGSTEISTKRQIALGNPRVDDVSHARDHKGAGSGGGLKKAVTFLSETAASRPEIIVSAVGKLEKGSFTDG